MRCAIKKKLTERKVKEKLKLIIIHFKKIDLKIFLFYILYI